MNSRTETRDVLIIGGGPAGLTAALYLGRARKSVIAIDGGNPRHAVSEGVHNFLTREGMPPAALRETAWEQMAAYPSVTQKTAAVTKLERIRLEDGTTLETNWKEQPRGRNWPSRATSEIAPINCRCQTVLWHP